MLDGERLEGAEHPPQGLFKLVTSIALSCAEWGGSRQGPRLSMAGQGHSHGHGHGDTSAEIRRVRLCRWLPLQGHVLSRGRDVFMQDTGSSGA